MLELVYDEVEKHRSGIRGHSLEPELDQTGVKASEYIFQEVFQ